MDGVDVYLLKDAFPDTAFPYADDGVVKQDPGPAALLRAELEAFEIGGEGEFVRGEHPVSDRFFREEFAVDGFLGFVEDSLHVEGAYVMAGALEMQGHAGAGDVTDVGVAA